MIVSETQAPPTGGMGGSIRSWERGLDHWHKDAFEGTGVTEEDLDNAIVIGDAKPSSGAVRKAGWNGLDWCGNVICFVADGAEIKGG